MVSRFTNSFFQAQKECPNYTAADMSNKNGAMLLLHSSKNPIRLNNCYANDFVITQISWVRNILDHTLPCSHHHRFALYHKVWPYPVKINASLTAGSKLSVWHRSEDMITKCSTEGLTLTTRTAVDVADLAGQGHKSLDGKSDESPIRPEPVATHR